MLVTPSAFLAPVDRLPGERRFCVPPACQSQRSSHALCRRAYSACKLARGQSIYTRACGSFGRRLFAGCVGAAEYSIRILYLQQGQARFRSVAILPRQRDASSQRLRSARLQRQHVAGRHRAGSPAWSDYEAA